MKVLVTGGAGFIGSAVTQHLLTSGDSVVVLDSLTYAGNRASLAPFDDLPSFTFEHADILDQARVRQIFDQHQPDAVMHLAAESHVDRSIDGPFPFIETNVVGTARLLEAALRYFNALSEGRKQAFRFHHISTDEVFGSLGFDDPPFNPSTAYAPRSPYSASKASSDHLVEAWGHTYGLPIVISNCSNNYGPRQFPEKLIPLMILKCLAGEPLPVYGKGDNVRDWLHVEDHAAALCLIVKQGTIGKTYLVGGDAERRNIDVVRTVCSLMDEHAPSASHGPHEALITYVADRPGHDVRYAIDSSVLRNELGWTPSCTFEDGLRVTVAWYLENRHWWEPIADGSYRGQRLGLDKPHPKPTLKPTLKPTGVSS